MKLYAFYHVYWTPQSDYILQEQLAVLEQVGLLKSLDKLFIGFVRNSGSPKGWKDIPSKAEVIYDSDNPLVYENPMISHIHKLTKKEDFNALYMHTKGASRPFDYQRFYWRRNMAWSVLEQWKTCVDLLTKYDIVGLAFSTIKTLQGNFWWSKSEYMKTIEEDPIEYPIDKNRFRVESWIGNGKNPKFFGFLGEHFGPIRKIMAKHVQLYNEKLYGKFDMPENKKISTLPNPTYLAGMFKKAKTDKDQHGYASIYERHFSHCREDVRDVLEIGVYNGASFEAWKDYFPRANLYGVDALEEHCIKTQGRIGPRFDWVVGRQEDPLVHKELHVKCKDGLNLIIDDGSHIPEHQIASFTGLFDLLVPGGVYVIEDVYPTWVGWKAIEFFEGLSRLVYYSGVGGGRRAALSILVNGSGVWENAPPIAKNILSVEFYRSMIVVVKGENGSVTR
jgi:hypothetical protein